MGLKGKTDVWVLEGYGRGIWTLVLGCADKSTGVPASGARAWFQYEPVPVFCVWRKTYPWKQAEDPYPAVQLNPDPDSQSRCPMRIRIYNRPLSSKIEKMYLKSVPVPVVFALFSCPWSTKSLNPDPVRIHNPAWWRGLTKESEILENLGSSKLQTICSVPLRLDLA
jgi:hypothetical protein